MESRDTEDDEFAVEDFVVEAMAGSRRRESVMLN